MGRAVDCRSQTGFFGEKSAVDVAGSLRKEERGRLQPPLFHMIIVQNILETPYKTKIGEMIFNFYTLKHKETFDERVEMWVDKINLSLSSRFSYRIEADVIAMIQLYSRIETYGFCIEFDGEIYTNIAQLSGRFSLVKIE